ncbi:AMP-binding protein [Pseudidiomarina salinarum]|uniref:AMP-binding protein n=1 Tax=Pseudidiomarina salinarum TaxID=435908 RepID=UPI000A5E69A0|nr:AMP-binding protein [Pseudidiomarina salinarum]
MWLSTDTNNWRINLPRGPNWESFAHQIASARAYLTAHQAQRWLLHQPQRNDFCVWLIALLCESKTPILPSNGQPDTLKNLRACADAVVPSGPPDPYSAWGGSLELRGALTSQVVFYTSGSNGEPKAVHKTLRQLFCEVQTLEATFGKQLGTSEVVTTITHQHIYGLLFTVLWPLCAGRNVARTRIEYPEQWQRYHRTAERSYVMVSSPAHLEHFSQAICVCEFPGALQGVFSSGGPLPSEISEAFITAQIQPPIEVYGSTETGGIAWRQSYTFNQPFHVFETIEIASGKDQLLRVRSPHLAGPEWYTTSDKVSLLSKAEFVILGRADRVIKLAEKRLSLNEMEALAEQLHWVKQAKCCVLEGQTRAELGLVITLNDAGEAMLYREGRFGIRQMLRHHLSHRFEPVVLPRRFRYVERMPYNDTGKITQAALSRLFVENPEC